MARLKNRYLNDFDFVLWVLQGQGVDDKWSLEPKSNDFEEAVRIVKDAQRRRPALNPEEKRMIMRRVRQSYQERHLKTPVMQGLKYAALSLAVILCGLGIGKLMTRGSVEETVAMIQFVAPEGCVSTLDLEDGTKVWLSGGTRLSYPEHFCGGDRRVNLVGEAFFDVAKVPGSRFVVESDYLDVIVKGTRFDLKTSPEPTETQSVLLVEGSIEVKMPMKDDAVLLSPSELLSYHNSSYLKLEVNPDDYLGWMKDKDNVLSGVNTIHEIAVRLSSYYGISVVCDSNVENIRCSGRLILSSNYVETLEVLKCVAPIKYTDDGNGTIHLKYNLQ